MQLLGNGNDSAWPTLGLWLHLKISIRLLSLRVALSFSSTWSHFVIWKTRGAWISFLLVFWIRLALWVASRFWKWRFSQREVLRITNKKCLDVVFPPRMIHSASPYLLLRPVQFYLVNPKQVTSKAQNYFQVRWPGHPCLQVLELWFDEFSQQRPGEPYWNKASAPAVVTFITLQSHVLGAPRRLSPVEIMKPDLSSCLTVCRRFFKSLLWSRKSQRCFVWRKKEQGRRMKLLGRDKETIQAVSTMSCLWKIIRFSVMAGEKRDAKMSF